MHATRSVAGMILGLLLALVAGGCNSTPQNDDVEKPEATYSGLKQQRAAVMVWADWTLRTEYNQIQLDLARLLRDRLAAQINPPKDEKKPAGPVTEFLNPASIVRFQREHPEIDSLPITDVAPRLGASRVVYVELTEFSAQSAESIMILKGIGKATLRVVEVSGGTAKVVFEEADITAHFPPHDPEGVVPSDKVNVNTIYEGTLTLLADKLAARFLE